jgi:ribonuclease BN (tRNA processing enzyme)
MNIRFLGTGSAFTVKNFQTNFAIEQNGKWLLVDAGGDLRFSLAAAGMSYKDISAVYVSHLHTDHSGGIEYLGFCTYFDPSTKEKIQLFGNGELLRKGWEDTWKGGMESIQGKLMSLDSFFDVNMVRPNGRFVWEDLEFLIVQSIHIMNGYAIVPSYGLMIKVPKINKTIYITTDCQFCPSQIMDFYKQADFVVQDSETTPFKSGVHANYSELITLPPDIKKKMVLTHYQDNVLDENGIKEEWKQKALTDGFIGFAEKGETTSIEALLVVPIVPKITLTEGK